jgi:hypothetical protein
MEYDGGLLGYLESIGLIPTREGRIQRVIQIFAAESGLDDNYNHQEEILMKYDLADLTPEEAEYINREVEKQI